MVNFRGRELLIGRETASSLRLSTMSRTNMSIHWHGIRQLQTGWFDSPSYVTQCLIRTGQSYVYNFTIVGQQGTLLWHAHLSWLRATVYGALVVLPKRGLPYPFAKPYKEVTILFGEWLNSDSEAIISQALRTGAGPNVSEAYTFKGLTGPLYNCSANETYKLKVKPGKTYLLRLMNAALNDELSFSIANHTLTVVEADAGVLITPGQTTNVLLRSLPHGSPVRPYATGLGAFDNTTAAAVLEYYDNPNNNGVINNVSALPKPTLPVLNDTSFAARYTSRLKSLASARFPANVPKTVDTNPCPKNQMRQGPNGTKFAASVNNVSMVLPATALLQAHYLGRSDGVYTTGFPCGRSITRAPPPNDTNVGNGTKAVVLPYNTSVEAVLQDTSIQGIESQPMHLHGYNFYVAGQGFGNHDPSRDTASFNLVDPVERNTAGVPAGGWIAIRFLADNPGEIDAHAIFCILL